VIEEDIPFELDFETQGLEDWDGRHERKPPDGTIVFRDDEKLTERWFPPRLLDKLFRRARSTGTIWPVLVKGPWDRIKKTYMKLSEDNVKAFVDEKGYAFALCVYTKGRPEYVLLKKPIWENHRFSP
jgi:hypothetical protein